eukprot:TRINITY_DN55011_c0_g1_i1.p1 TRINITY_DN55011_c0_g1~~TRINITY_DN55011_c0_g1_i1.p1  ORF type:complete len:832 (+),score=217.27 TRINITY_DN55011_c0_g1_i1:70-2565(+)
MYDEDLDDDDFDLSGSEVDPLDADDFNAVNYINRQFPTEASLSGLDDYVERLRAQKKRVDEEIRHAIRRQAACGRRARADLDEGKAAVRELFERIQAIQAKAEQSEALVSDVCRDIKSLDVAKRNLTLTVTALKRLVMLVTALEQLKAMSASRRYREAAGLIRATEELAGHFRELQHVPRVADLLASREAILDALRAQILEDYASLHGPEHAHAEGVEDAAYIVDAMGEKVRRDVITQFCLSELEDYKDIFEPPKPYAGLENAERRYTWLKKKLKQLEQRHGTRFPESWRVPCGLCEHFCHVSRQHLVEVLSTSHHTVDPELMVRALRKSIEFENELARRYPPEDAVAAEAAGAEDGAGYDGLAQLGLKYPDALGASGSKSSGSTAGDRSAAERAKSAAAAAPRFVGTISVCFEAYLSSWVQHEEKKLLEALDRKLAPGMDKIVGQDDDRDEDRDGGMEPRIWFESAPDLFGNMKASCTNCTGFSTHQTLFDLFQVFRKVLAVYVDKLEALLPKKVSQALETSAIQTACCIIGTAEYCDEMAQQFGEFLLKVIDPSFVERVTFCHEQDLLRGMHNRANQVLVQSVSSSLDEGFLKMTRTNWAQFSQDVGDNSPYVGDISSKLSSQFAPVAQYLSKSHYRFFCDKFVQVFVARYISEIYKCRKISEQGGQQLLLDTSFIKTTLLEVPVTAQGSGRQMQTAYSNYVLKEMDKVATMLQVLASPEVDPSSVGAMLGKGSSREDVERLLALRVGYDGEVAGLLPSGSGGAGIPGAPGDGEAMDSSGVDAFRKSVMSFGDTLHQNRTKMAADMKDMKKKLFNVNLSGIAGFKGSST